jgi:hypothetical protein
MAKTTGSQAASNDDAAPPSVILEIKSPQGDVWGVITASAKEFKTGSKGYYANGKVVNPKSGSRYQIGSSIILIGSKK